mgnify:CR=1 FL=1
MLTVETLVKAEIKGIQYKSTYDYLQIVSFGFIQFILYECVMSFAARLARGGDL